MGGDAMRVMAGLGFRAGATAESLADALARAGVAPDGPAGAGAGLAGMARAGTARAGLSRPGACGDLAVAEDRAGHPAVRALVARGWRVHPVPPDRLAQPTLTESPAARAARGTGSLAEACALAALGPGARLRAPRAISADRMASAAVAETEAPA